MQNSDFTWKEIIPTTEDISEAIESMPKYKRNKARRAARNTERQFVAVDGEGITYDGDAEQSYVLLGMSDGIAHRSITSRSLSTEQCFRFLLRAYETYPAAEFVAFSFNYDVTMMTKDIPDAKLMELKQGEWIRWKQYRLKWRPGKWFELKNRDVYVKIYDVFSFFGCKFTKAIEQYIPDSPELELLESMKAQRGGDTWTLDRIDAIEVYMTQELICMVRMMDKLKSLLASIDVKPLGWHGPGAIATSLINSHKVRSHRAELSKSVNRAAQYAYFGGRFESLYCGLYTAPIYQYDIRSAYPYALTQVPSITGRFIKHEYPDIPDGPVPNFSLCKITYTDEARSFTGINPVPLRDRRGSIFYPSVVTTWVWGVEYNQICRFPGLCHLSMVVELEDNGERPFSFVGDLYTQRAQWKSEGNPAQLAAKLGMNSIYGKLAQRVGYNDKTNEPPRNHQLSWAGFVTASCRAQILEAVLQSPESVVAIETDAIFTTRELDLPCGTGLGQWDREIYEQGIMYVQSGVYFVPENGEWTKARTRGFNSGPSTASDVFACLDSLTTITRHNTRFHSLTGPVSKLRQWENLTMEYAWGGTGKRMHIEEFCDGCKTGSTWHNTVWRRPDDPQSYPHYLPWEKV